MAADYHDYSNLFFFKTAFAKSDFEKHLIKECFLLRTNGIPVLNFYMTEAPDLFNKNILLMLLQGAFLHKRILEALWLLDLISYDGQGIPEEGMEFTPIEANSEHLTPIYIPDSYYHNKPKNNLLQKGIYKDNHPAWLFILGLFNQWQILDVSYHNKISSNAIEFSYNVFPHRKITPFFTEKNTQELIFHHTKPETHSDIKDITIELNIFYK